MLPWELPVKVVTGLGHSNRLNITGRKDGWKGDYYRMTIRLALFVMGLPAQKRHINYFFNL